MKQLNMTKFRQFLISNHTALVKPSEQQMLKSLSIEAAEKRRVRCVERKKRGKYKKKNQGSEQEGSGDITQNKLAQAFNNYQKCMYRYLQSVSPQSPDFIHGFNEMVLSDKTRIIGGLWRKMNKANKLSYADIDVAMLIEKAFKSPEFLEGKALSMEKLRDQIGIEIKRHAE